MWTMSSRLEGWIAAEAVLGHFRVRIQSLLFPAAVVRAAGPWDPSFPVCHDLEFIARALEHARVRPDPAVATCYRKHEDSVTSGFERGVACSRHPQSRTNAHERRDPSRRGTAFERRAVASRHAVAARARATRGMVAPALRRLVRSLALDPREAALEAWAALPALRGHVASAAGHKRSSARAGLS